MNSGSTLNGSGRTRNPPRNGRPDRGLQTAAPARPKVGMFNLSVGVLAVIVAVFFALSNRSPKTRSSPSAAVVEASQTEASESVAGDTPPPAQHLQAAVVGTPAKPAAKSMEDQWGIQITSMRVGFGGNGLDLRYKVTDPVKAANLLHLKEITYIIDQGTGKAIPLPFQKENQTSQKLVAGKTYFALLSNKGQVVKPGSKVTVAIGNSREQDVMVE